MTTFLILVEYDGTHYAGSQVQKNANTIQGEIEKALKKLCKKDVRIHGSGRTDSGVHAIAHPFHFKIETKLKPKDFHRALNTFLPRDIVITKVTIKPEGFHARFSAKKKKYQYRLLNSSDRAPLIDRYSYRIIQPLDLEKMKKALTFIEGEHDFRSYAGRKTPDERHTVRTIYSAKLTKKGRELIMTFEGNGFLYNMVRILVGTVADVGRGKTSLTEFKKILAAKDRKKAGPTAPAKGLFLEKVTY